MNKQILSWYLSFLTATGILGIFYGYTPFWCILALPFILALFTVAIILIGLIVACIIYTPVVIYTKLVLSGVIKRKNKGGS